MVSALDDALPQVVDALRTKGMWANTVLIVTTDNGGNLGGSGNNWPLRGGKFTFWQGGVRGISFINSPLLPKAMVGGVWPGMMHAVDWYTTIAELSGASADNTGPVPADGYAMWSAITSNAASPRTEMIINIDTASYTPPSGAWKAGGIGCLRQGKWKVINGYPGWNNKAWNGWVPLPDASDPADEQLYGRAEISDEEVLSSPYISLVNEDGSSNSSILFGNAADPCSAAPCLFDVLAGESNVEENVIFHNGSHSSWGFAGAALLDLLC
jgi:hypothetical protein